MISRHFDLNRFRGSLITSQSVFAIALHGYSISDLQDFSSQVMKVLNQIPQDEWPRRVFVQQASHSEALGRGHWWSQKIPWIFGKAQFRLCVDPASRVEEREELNARSVEQSLRLAKKATQPKAKPLAAPAVQPESISSKQPEVKAAPANPKAVPKASAKEGGKGKGKSKTKSTEEKTKTACIIHQMPSGCVHGDKCAYSHAASAKSSAPKPSAEAKSKPKASGPSPKVAAAVALVAAVSSVVCPSQAFGTLEWAANSGAGRHLISHEALRDQGFGEPRYGNFLNQSHEHLRFSTGGGQRKSSQAWDVRDHAGVFGDANHFVLDSCPCVRSVGLDVKDGLGCVWFPGQLPFYIKDCSKISLCCGEDNKIFANRVSENVPFFSINFDFIPGMPAKAVADPGDVEVLTPPELAMEPVVSAVEPGLEGGAESSSIADIEVFTPPELAMEPVVSAVEPGLEGGAESFSLAAKVREVAPDVPPPKLPESTVHARAEAVSIKHRISHFPKHPVCDICNRAKLFSKRGKSHRVHDPESDLPVPTAFGEQIAIDHMIVSKSAGGREFLALIVFDCFSGIVNAYPAPTKGSDFLCSCLRRFVGVRYKNPDTVCRSDAAPELIKAIRELGWLPETSLPCRWPHNSRCERAIRSFEECCRYLHLQAGFAVMPRLWVTTCRYAAMAMNIDKWESALGASFKGANYAVGQLVSYRTKSQYKPKLDPNAQPALMAGWKLDFGMRYKGVLLVLDYHALCEGKITCVQAPRQGSLHSWYCHLSACKCGWKSAWQLLWSISGRASCAQDDVELEELLAGEFPPEDDFEYEPSIVSHDPLDDDVVPECPSEDAEIDEEDSISGVTSGMSVIASVACDAVTLLSHDQVQGMFQDVLNQGGQASIPGTAASPSIDAQPKKWRNMDKHKLSGSNVLFEFACDKDLNLGTVGREHGIRVYRLCKEDIDLEDPENIEQLIQQVNALPGCSIHCPIECKPWSQWQRLNQRKHPRLSASVKKERKNSEALLKQFIRVANACIKAPFSSMVNLL